MPCFCSAAANHTGVRPRPVQVCVVSSGLAYFAFMTRGRRKVPLVPATDRGLKFHTAAEELNTISDEFFELRNHNSQYTSVLESLKKEIVLLHPGPINRGVEITSDVADSKNAIILDQVENGVAIRMAIIYLLVAKMNFPST